MQGVDALPIPACEFEATLIRGPYPHRSHLTEWRDDCYLWWVTIKNEAGLSEWLPVYTPATQGPVPPTREDALSVLLYVDAPKCNFTLAEYVVETNAATELERLQSVRDYRALRRNRRKLRRLFGDAYGLGRVPAREEKKEESP